MTDSLRQVVRRLFHHHRSESAIALLLSILSAATEGIGLLLLLPILAAIGTTGNTGEHPNQPILAALSDNLYLALGLFLVMLALRQLIVFFQRVRVMQARLAFSQGIRLDLFTALANARWEHFSAGNLHRQTQILTLDCHRAGDAALQFFGLAAAVFLTVIQLSIATWISIPFTVIVLGTAVVIGWSLRSRLQRLGKLGEQLTANNDAVYGLMSNLLPLIRTARMTSAPDKLIQKFREKNENINSTVARYIAIHTANTVLLQLAAATALCICVVLWVDVLTVSSAELVLLVVIFARLTPVFAQIQQILQKLAHDLPAVTNAEASIALWHQRSDTVPRVPAILTQPANSIGLVHVYGGFHDSAGEAVVRDVSMDIPVGRVSALTGPTGAGKSTVADITAGLLRPLKGHVCLDGRPLAPDQLVTWRTHVGYVHQDSVIFSGTVRENLMFGLDRVDTDWFEEVMEAALVTSLIDELPQGLSTFTGEQGGRLSGGQRKRIAIARELMREPWLLILDEATSALDAESEARLIENVTRLSTRVTVLLITHRRSTLAYADRIFHIDKGRMSPLPSSSCEPAHTLPPAKGAQA